MARTTLDIDPQVLDELRRLQAREKKPLGRLASDLLAEAMARHGAAESPSELSWRSRALGARVDLADKAAVYAKLDDPR